MNILSRVLDKLYRDKQAWENYGKTLEPPVEVTIVQNGATLSEYNIKIPKSVQLKYIQWQQYGVRTEQESLITDHIGGYSGKCALVLHDQNTILLMNFNENATVERVFSVLDKYGLSASSTADIFRGYGKPSEIFGEEEGAYDYFPPITAELVARGVNCRWTRLDEPSIITVNNNDIIIHMVRDYDPDKGLVIPLFGERLSDEKEQRPKLR